MKNSMYPPDSCGSLWYDPTINRFKDESGAILNDLTGIFPTWVIDKWKKHKKYDTLKDLKGNLWELHYDEFNCKVECGSNCKICPSRCEVYELFYEEPYGGYND